MKPKKTNNDIPKSMMGKHDFQLQNELKEALINAGVKYCSPSIERRRARIKIKFDENDFNLIRNVVVTMFPEFIIDKVENGYILFTVPFYF